MKPLIKLLKKREKLLKELDYLDFEIDECNQTHLLNERFLCMENLTKLQKQIKQSMLEELKNL